MLQDIRKTINYYNIREFSVRKGTCPMCGKTLFLKLSNYIWAIRCLKCRGGIAAISMVTVLKNLHSDYDNLTVYELSSRGAFLKYLKKNIKNLYFSEFFDDVKPGSFKNGVQCQDVQKLTYDDVSFDVCTSTEVFEHVPDDIKGFSEIYRVLKPFGVFLFTVPFSKSKMTVERVKINQSGEMIHLLKPEYHDDRVRGIGRVLCLRNYGSDIVNRLRDVGFRKVDIIYPDDPTGWGFYKPVIVAHKT